MRVNMIEVLLCLYEKRIMKPVKIVLKREEGSWALVTHVCNPNYSGQRSGGSKFEASQGK
jgi:hypothetical protein